MSTCGSYHIIGNYAHRGRNHECGCQTDNSCCTAEPIPSSGVIYSGPNLPCTGIRTCEDLDTALQKIDAQICELAEAVYNLNLLVNP